MTNYCNANDTIRMEMKLSTGYKDLYHYFKYADAMECDPLEDTLSQITQSKFFSMYQSDFSNNSTKSADFLLILRFLHRDWKSDVKK